MPVIQLMIGMMAVLLFLVLFIWVAWYVAVPILIVFGALSGLRWLQQQWQLRQIYRDANGCTIRKSRPRRQAETTIIDVDYTEIR